MTFFKQTIKTVPIDGQTVLVRADYNVPLKDDGSLADDFRIRASLPTIEWLLKRGCKVIIISHLGRPEGREQRFSLEPIAQRLANLLQRPVRFVDQTVGDRPLQAVKRAPKSSVIMLENLRFDPREEANDEQFAREIAKTSGARFFVQDGFGAAHRAHASTDAITMHLPSVAGLLLEREYSVITEAMQAPKRPLVAVLGGAKVSDKIGLIKSFAEVADKVVIGGAMANNFLAHQGHPVGKSKLESDVSATMDEIFEIVKSKPAGFMILPTDVAVAAEISPNAERRVVKLDEVKESDIILDVGDETIETIASEVEKAGTVIWNGTLGYAELAEFAHGSARLALSLATNPAVSSIIGGGDTADFVIKWDAEDGASFDHVSTGGGASLELMAGKKLPGIESLLDA